MGYVVSLPYYLVQAIKAVSLRWKATSDGSLRFIPYVAAWDGSSAWHFVFIVNVGHLRSKYTLTICSFATVRCQITLYFVTVRYIGLLLSVQVVGISLPYSA